MQPDTHYATFSGRLAAGIVDFVLHALLTFSVGWIASQSKQLAYAVMPTLWLVLLLYEPFLHARFGATLGKLAVGIRVVYVSGAKIGWRAALLRSSVSMVVMAYWVYCVAASIYSLQDSDFQGQGWSNLFQLVRPHFPESYEAVEPAMGLWFWSEFLTMLFNSKRRAIHDFLAGTVVVRAATSASRIGRSA